MAFSRTREGRRVEWGSVEEVFAGSDVVSLHVPLAPETKGMVNMRLLARMKGGVAYLINTARGGLVVEADLAEAALRSGEAGGCRAGCGVGGTGSTRTTRC